MAFNASELASSRSELSGLRAARADALLAEHVALDTRCTEQQAAVQEIERRRQPIERGADEAAFEMQRLLDQRAMVSR